MKTKKQLEQEVNRLEGILNQASTPPPQSICQEAFPPTYSVQLKSADGRCESTMEPLQRHQVEDAVQAFFCSAMRLYLDSYTIEVQEIK